jgi:hypothetical protein
VFVLRAVEGMSIAETAEALSIRPQTVKTRLHRARHRLQETLGARLDALLPVTFDFGGERCDRIVQAVPGCAHPSTWRGTTPVDLQPRCPTPSMTARLSIKLTATATAHDKRRSLRCKDPAWPSPPSHCSP